MEEDEKITRLHKLEDEDMQRWQDTFMPPGSNTQCMIILGLSVDPKHQRKGVGSALLKWGADRADELGVFTWVHSSEMAWKAYEKAGFEVQGTLDLDLDEWAPRPPPVEEEGEGAKWGRYVCRYMKRLPRNS